MKKETVVQFIGFITRLKWDEFAPQWESFSQKLMSSGPKTVLQEQASETKSKFRYIARHEWSDRDFQFNFLKESRASHFPEQSARVLQIGGYTPMQDERRQSRGGQEVKLTVFIGHNENDIDFYRQLVAEGQFNSFQAYYESCSYAYVFEYFVPGAEAENLLGALKQRPGLDAGIYREFGVVPA